MQRLFSLNGLIEIDNPAVPDMVFVVVPIAWTGDYPEFHPETGRIQNVSEKRIESLVRMEILPADLQTKIREFVRTKNSR